MSVDMTGIWLVAMGGALGGMGRLAVGNAVGRRLGTTFPWGTLAVNLSGALALGVLAGWPARGESPLAWPLLAVGLLGGYTTVSAFSLQTLTLWQQGRHGAVLANIALTLLAGIAAVALGAWVAGSVA